MKFEQVFPLSAFLQHLPHSIFCWPFHSGHTLKMWSHVCFWHRRHQHWAVGRFFVQYRYCPDEQLPVFSW